MTMIWSLRIVGASLRGVGDGVGGFEGGEDAFELGEQLEGFERFGVGDADVLDAAGVLPVRVLGADAGVIQAGAERMDVGGLAVVVLQDVAESSRAARRACPAMSVAACWPRSRAAPAGFDADEFHVLCRSTNGAEDARGVRSAADAGDDVIGQSALGLKALALAFRCRSRTGNRGRSSGTGAGRRRCR